MARVNVFGKPIVFDVGANVNGDQRTPATTVKEGDDLSAFTKKQAEQFLNETTRDNDVQPGETFSDDSTNLNSYSNSSLQAQPVPAPEERSPDMSVVKKGKGPSPGLDGNKLLPSVTPDDKNVVPRYTSAVLSKNRFTSAKRRNGTEQFRVNPDHPQEGFGSWNGYRSSPNGKEFGDGDLAHVGTLLTLRATKELGAGTAYGADGPDGAGASLAAILPGGSQSGLLKVNVSDLDVTDVLNSIIDNKVESANLDASKALSKHRVLAINSESYGQMNNALESFSGLLPLGMIGLSTALVLALKVAIRGVLAVFLLITSASKSASKKTDSIGRHFLGNYQQSDAFEGGGFPPVPLPATLFGLRETRHPFGDCVNAGIESFFGGGLGDSFKRILETPGFYAVFCRSIVMSAATIVDQIKDVVKGNPVQIAQNIIALVEVLKSSKVVSAMNMFAQIGDAALTLKESDNIINGRLSSVDAVDDTASTGYKSRLKDSLRLAWGVGNSPSAYLLPAAFQGSLAAFSQLAKASTNPALTGLVRNRIDAVKALGDPGRHSLPHSVVRETEAVLDAEYMPFYFHDLRTHEIIAFPAFLSALNDSYSGNWENSEGYGRVDPVRIYKSTGRKISLGFFIVSTNIEDFDQMWFKINKLVTMIYPQWSEGTLLKNTDAEVKFTQPFSQVPTASPVIRLRLGDLFRSNYSRFALARLFGVGDKATFSLPDLGDLKIDDNALRQIEARAKDFFDDSKALKTGVVYDAYPGEYEEAEDASGGALGAALAGAASAATGGLVGAAKPKERHYVHLLTRAVLTKVIDNDTYQIAFVSEKNTPLWNGKKFVAKRSQLAINTDILLSQLSPGSITTSDIEALKKFFDPTQNAVVRSFESVSGKGLACTVDSIDFTWLDNVTWETQVYGSRAPKMCRVQMSVTPIHDIAPGLDSNGFNRAPVYNVGRAVNSFGGDSWDEEGKGKETFMRRLSYLSGKLAKR